MDQEQIQSVQGTEDLLPGQWALWTKLYGTARRLFERYGYGEIRTPVFEDTRLFVKGTGETTEIVEKQMYSIPTGEDESITLRPEGTPPVIRSYLEHGLHKQRPFQKLYYVGPMFRRERPQKGRLRQFHQLGVEAIGSSNPLLDAETIVLAVAVFHELGLSDFEVRLNTIGCAECRGRLRAEMRRALEPRLSELCDDCRRRIDRNVFRVLDCNNEGCRAIVVELPTVAAGVCSECAEHYSRVKAALDAAGVEYAEDPFLVRGLDYYTRTVYEVRHRGIGARDAICGGGRYDGLVELLGGPPTPSLGFAIGAESTILAMESEQGGAPDEDARVQAFVVCFEDEARQSCFELLHELRAAGVSADMDYEGRSAKAQMRTANRLGAKICLLVGRDELEQGTVTVRDMTESEQRTVPRAEAVAAARCRVEPNPTT